MRYTNDHNIDAPIAEAIATNAFYDEHDADISISQLVAPARQKALALLHDDEIVEDVSSGLWALLGSAVHVVIEQRGKSDYSTLTEERFFMDVLGWRVSGKPDVLTSKGILIDYKVTSVWSFLLGEKPDWEMQLNFYAELLRRNGYEIKGLKISAILRDWTVSKVYDQGYPKIPFMSVEVPLWSPEQAALELDIRVREHQAARGGVLPECTPQERWHQPDKWAAMKSGNIRATKVFDEELLCLDFANTLKGGYVEHRPGRDSRCAEYCSAAPFCEQYQAIKAEEVQSDDLIN